MKIALKIALGLVGVAAFLVLATCAFVEATYDKDYAGLVAPPIKASVDPQVIKRGEYIVHAVAHCSACHAPADKAARRELGTTDLQGGFRIEAGPFGTFIPANITSDNETGIGGWTDEELARLLKHGVGRDGKLRVFMRLTNGSMSDEDVAAVISYLRTLPGAKNVTPPSELGIVGKIVARNLEPRGAAPTYAPAGEVSAARGAYLANGPAHCAACHTSADPMNGFAMTGALLAGGDPDPDLSDAAFELVAPNITTGGVLKGWSEEQFIARFRLGRVHAGSKMAWESFKLLTDEDLKSLYLYLQSVPPSPNDVGPIRRPAGWKPS